MKIDGTVIFAAVLIFFGFLVILFLPYALTNFQFLGINFTQTGQIGDTIGGITAPFLALINATLMFLTIRTQIKANKIIQDQILSDTDSKKINTLFEFLQNYVDTIGTEELDSKDFRLINNVASSINFVISEYKNIDIDIDKTKAPKIKSINIQINQALKIIKRLFELLQSSKAQDKDIILFMLKNIFNTRFKPIAAENYHKFFSKEVVDLSVYLKLNLGKLEI